MTTKQLLRILDNPRWDYTKSFEQLQIGKCYGYPCTYYRYKNSILTSPGAHFFVATKRKYRGNGYAEELIFFETFYDVEDTPSLVINYNTVLNGFSEYEIIESNLK